jgi:hypothetical protein
MGSVDKTIEGYRHSEIEMAITLAKAVIANNRVIGYEQLGISRQEYRNTQARNLYFLKKLEEAQAALDKE